MAGDVEHIVDASENPQIAIVVTLGAIARKVQVRTPGPFCEIGLNVSLVVPPNRAEHRRPWLGHCEQTATDFNALGGRVEKIGGVTGQWFCRASRLGRRDSRERRDHDRARLRLPPCVDYRATVAADVLAIPHPGFGIDRLTNG